MDSQKSGRTAGPLFRCGMPTTMSTTVGRCGRRPRWKPGSRTTYGNSRNCYRRYSEHNHKIRRRPMVTKASAYQLIVSSDPSDMTDQITDFLGKGWQLFGPPMMTASTYQDVDESDQVSTQYVQAIILP